MNKVIVAVKTNKLAQTIMGACQDRGVESERIPSPELEGAIPAQPEQTILILNLDDLGTKSEKKIIAFIENIPKDIRVLGLGAGFELKAVTAFFRAGLSDFLSLPPDPLELSQALTNLLTPLVSLDNPERQKHAPPDSVAASSVNLSSPGRSIIGQSRELMKVFRLIEKVAVSDATVMIQGESGTGKELIARAIHQASPRRDKPLIPVNCGAIPEELLEAEFFGHEKGAFTGAVRERIGRFEMAEGGTIFLDEIGDMSAKLQVKLLRVLQEREFERIGGQKTIVVDIRIITATNLDLPKAVADGRFREDLFYRLNVIPLLIPPLRERSEDIPLLIDYFLGRLRQTRSSQVKGVAPETLKILMAYHWPGNIRELENLLERMVILSDGDILTDEDLPPRLLEKSRGQRPLPKITNFMEPLAENTAQHDNLSPESYPANSNYETNSEASPQLNPESSLDFRPDFNSFALKPNFSNFNWTNLELELKEIIAPLVDFPDGPLDLADLVSKYESVLINSALSLSGGVKNEAARRLSINRTTLVEKLRKLGLADLK
jgi:DNA-binding NtrC family response regulator